jgi:hypothetical protein
MNRLFTKIHALAFQLRMFLRNGSVHRYEYAVEMSSDTAAANVVRMVGTGRKVLEIAQGRDPLLACSAGRISAR